jgi:hypothetical protein
MVRFSGRLLMLSSLVALAALPLFGIDADIAGGVVLVAVGSEDGGTDTVRRVVVSSAELYLEQEGLIAIESESRPAAGDLPARVFRDADDVDADFVLRGLVGLRGNEVTVTLSLFLVETRERLSEASTTEQVGLTLDRAIAGLTGNVLERARPYLIAAATERRNTDPGQVTEDATAPSRRDRASGPSAGRARGDAGESASAAVAS